MSGFLAGKVWQSALDPDLKPLAAALADIANDDGTSIYPSVAYVCWLLGRSRRAVQVQLDKLRKAGILVKIRDGGGLKESGYGRTTEYRLVESSFPQRTPWRELVRKKGATDALLSNGNGAVLPFEQRGLSQTTLLSTAPYPSVKTASEETNKTHPLTPSQARGRVRGEIMADFGPLWDSWPNKQKPREAIRAFQEINPTSETMQEIFVALTEVQDKARRGIEVPILADFLRSGAWRTPAAVEASR